ncbi:3-hydroxyisobutyrate dehydrogenase [Acuticoccus sp. MNP-M23]|uniref:3-hydroxyisobutyrate dehydrogenase n=1 Tax=Acuticoccus sp. MNP-M23 TaxID=3072793 RepID=UPI00281617D0|nr:3-hydroxyisobutyrate dehydrogenase [Acuticoccus sp. MNP-M23]WMS43359.1 3-hydroxyisobutyrate dehydrogenase [Acuticoccus sp. MNP-M23]
MESVAFIGLGNMGAPMARNLAEAGHKLIGFDVAAPAREAFTAAGGRVAESAAEAVSGANVVITMLPAGDHVRAVMTGDDGILARAAPDALLIDCSTIDVEAAREVAAAAAESGRAMCDAPVSGGVSGASAGTLTFMVGGLDEAFARAEPILKRMGRNIVHAGAAGAGQAAKICNNMILGISMIAVSEAFNLADALGLERQKLFDIASTASGQCWALTTYCPVPGPVPTSPANRDYAPGFTGAMMLKDLRLAAAAAAHTGTHTPLGGAARAVYDDFCQSGEAAKDFSGIVAHLRRVTEKL